MEYVIALVALGLMLAFGIALWSGWSHLRNVSWERFKPSKGLMGVVGVVALASLGHLVDEEKSSKPSGCQADISCWGELHRISAQVRCEDRIEQLAKYEYDWNVGFGETTFSTWSWGGNDKNVLRACSHF